MKCEKIELGITDITKAKFLNEHLVANINNNTITILDVIEAKVIKIIRNLPFQYISDILLIDNNLYIVGVGVEFLVYNIETNQFSKIFLSHIGKIEGSAILILNDYFLIADDISESIKIYDKYFNYISNFRVGYGVKQIYFDRELNLLIICICESEDTGYLLFYRVEGKIDIIPYNIQIRTFFAISGIIIDKISDKLILYGGYPPLNIQIHKYSNLEFNKELVLNEDYTNDVFGVNISESFNITCCLFGNNYLLYPYSGGEVMLIDLINNTVKSIYNKDEIYIFSYIVDNKILCISREGVATYINCYLEKSLNKNIENTINKGFPFPQVVEEKSFTFRYSIEPEENYIYLKRIS
ncbi:hypothetical protein [Capnocytophaga gingivalis]|uniref:hypothetical protein n=1 Tax=Capnocytophaga gingivalis TaxID=1017 RepID=UPI00403D63E1